MIQAHDQDGRRRLYQWPQAARPRGPKNQRPQRQATGE